MLYVRVLPVSLDSNPPVLLSQIAKDVKALELWDTTEDMLHFTVGLCGVSHAGQVKSEKVRAWRNPMTYPWKHFK